MRAKVSLYLSLYMATGLTDNLRFFEQRVVICYDANPSLDSARHFCLVGRRQENNCNQTLLSISLYRDDINSYYQSS